MPEINIKIEVSSSENTDIVNKLCKNILDVAIGDHTIPIYGYECKFEPVKDQSKVVMDVKVTFKSEKTTPQRTFIESVIKTQA